jgi:hypothetical protein
MTQLLDLAFIFSKLALVGVLSVLQLTGNAIGVFTGRRAYRIAILKYHEYWALRVLGALGGC